jgi:hypothetical protein
MQSRREAHRTEDSISRLPKFYLSQRAIGSSWLALPAALTVTLILCTGATISAQAKRSDEVRAVVEPDHLPGGVHWSNPTSLCAQAA